MNALLAGAVGAATTNLLHEAVRRTVPNAPRVDLLGMQALAKLIAMQTTPPSGDVLYAMTFAGDLISNTLYFSVVRSVPRRFALPAGIVAGALAGVGGVVLPKPMGLSTKPTARTALTQALTVALYTAGGIAAGLAARSRSTET
jgi:hypothetical protein